MFSEAIEGLVSALDGVVFFHGFVALRCAPEERTQGEFHFSGLVVERHRRHQLSGIVLVLPAVGVENQFAWRIELARDDELPSKTVFRQIIFCAHVFSPFFAVPLNIRPSGQNFPPKIDDTPRSTLVPVSSARPPTSTNARDRCAGGGSIPRFPARANVSRSPATTWNAAAPDR